MWGKSYSYYDDLVIHTTEMYKYPGTILDITLSLSNSFTECTKKQPPNFADCTYCACTLTVLQKLKYLKL